MQRADRNLREDTLLHLSLPAPAKLNLFLHVTALRDDGYHEIQTVFQLLDYGDTLMFSRRADTKVRVRCEYVAGLSALPRIPEQDNSVVQVAAALHEHCHRQKSARFSGVDMRLQKRIPAGSGLGGGSSDAATALHALNWLWQCNLEPDALAEIGAASGADVPVFVHGTSAWAEGRGDRLEPVALPPKWYAVLVPPVRVSTTVAFQAPDLARNCPRTRMQDYVHGSCGNVFQPVIERRYPVVAKALRWLEQHGRAQLSGSGSSVFASFDTCAAAARVMANKPADCFGFVARGMQRSPLLDSMAGLGSCGEE